MEIPNELKLVKGQPVVKKPFNLSDFVRKSMILISMVLVSNRVVLFFLGILNRLLGRPIRGILLCYPAHEKYAHKYVFKWMFPIVKKKPMFAGFYFQSLKAGLTFVIYCHESQFRSDADYLKHIGEQMSRLKFLTGVLEVNCTGILPTELHRASLIPDDFFRYRCRTVGKVVVQAEKKVRQLNDLKPLPVIVLGGMGNVGREICDLLKSEGRKVYSVEYGQKFPSTVRDHKAVLIDCSRKGVLESRMEELWSGLILLNETFPEPKSQTVRQLKNMGIDSYHVTGAKAKAYPPFPYAYQGGIPCCGTLVGDNVEALVKDLVVRK